MAERVVGKALRKKINGCISAFEVTMQFCFNESYSAWRYSRLWNKNLNTILHHSIASNGLIVFITMAAFVYFRLFGFVAKPGGALYFLAYLSVGIPLLFVFRKLGTGVPG